MPSMMCRCATCDQVAPAIHDSESGVYVAPILWVTVTKTTWHSLGQNREERHRTTQREYCMECSRNGKAARAVFGDPE